MHIGIHAHKGDNKTTALAVKEVLKKWTLAQIYTHGPRGYNEINLDVAEMKKISKQIPIYVHSTHFSKPFNGKPQAIGHIKAQIDKCKEIGAKGLVIHLPKDIPDVICQHIKQFDNPDVQIILEMTAVKPDDHKTYETPEKINNLIDHLEDIEMKNYCICIDTAHIFAAHVDCRKKEVMDEYFSRIEQPDKIGLFHLNGTSVPFGGHKDVHEIIMSNKDEIWKDIPFIKSGIVSILEFCKQWDIPIVLEINRGEEHALDKAHKMIFDWVKKNK